MNLIGQISSRDILAYGVGCCCCCCCCTSASAALLYSPFPLFVPRSLHSLASAGTFFHAALPALEFVSKVRELSDVKHKGQSRPNVITGACFRHTLSAAGRCLIPHTHACATVRSTFTLKQVIGRLAATKVHRVYVVDGEGKPAAVVSLKDLLRHFVASSASAAASS